MAVESQPTSQMHFAWPWRPYQQRVLEAIETHLADNRLHIVAAPGSGKTILGLETFRRLGKPAVVLSPTTTIRDQWISRLEHFLPADQETPPAWVSCDLAEPGFLTSITYQALHTKFRNANAESDDEESGDENGAPNATELSKVIRRFREIGVGTLMLDEAHHLRREWWKALSYVVDKLDGVTLVSLTATPPYDVVGAQWRRYEELCGPIDEEISVPELVKSGTLSPHQDYVWGVQLSATAAQNVSEYDAEVERTTAALLADEPLLVAVQAHPWIADPRASADQVLGSPEFAVAMLVYLRARGVAPPPALLKLIDAEPDDLPELAKRWWQVLIEHYLYDDSWAPDEGRENHRDELAKRLRASGLLYRRELRLLRSRSVESAISLAPEKIDACVSIHHLERELRGDDLKQVFLTDFIRDENAQGPGDSTERQLGAFPLFRTLVRDVWDKHRSRIALLTGRLVIIHSEHAEAVQNWAGAAGEALSIQAAEEPLEGFVRITSPGGSRLVGLFTNMLAEGRLKVLVGTRALLGEGWDAPAINSLVLASYVGSYMLTNQMRGRAIRRDPADQSKIASVWHIVGDAPNTPSGWADLDGLHRRFETFVGVGANRPILESGLDRLELPRARGLAWVATVNRETTERLADLQHVARLWESAIEYGDVGRVLPSVRTNEPPRIQRFVFFNTLCYLAATIASVYAAAYSAVAESFRFENPRFVLWVIFFAGVGATVFALPRLVQAVRLLLRHLPIDGSLRAIALALHRTLRSTGHIASGQASSAVRISEISPGVFSAALAGATFRESALFADCLGELLGPIENPRYMLTRPGDGWFVGRKDYHAVPQILAVRKELAAALHKAWRRELGGGDLIYTRSSEGRRNLLRARTRAFSNAFTETVRRLDRWQ